MGRNVKPGITFYRMDSGHRMNKKIRLLVNEFDSNGYYIWSCLVDLAYEKWGYYIDTNDTEELELFAADIKKPLSLVREVIKGCIRRGLFDETVADAFGILTSVMMQEVFIYATADRRKKGSSFEMQENWLLLDFKGIIPVSIEIVPGKKEVPPGKKSQTKQDNTIQDNSAPASPAREKKFVKKQEEKPELYWQEMVDAYFVFIKKNFPGEEPSFTGRDPKTFKALVQLLKKRAAKKELEWNLANAVGTLNYFLKLAHSETWLQQHFLLKNLVEQFDAVYQRAISSKPGKDQKQGTPAAYDSSTKFGKELVYLVDRFREGNLDDRVLTPDIYSNLERLKLVPAGYMQKFPGETLDQKSLAAIKEWLRLQSQPECK
jgi:hypothetical protein